MDFLVSFYGKFNRTQWWVAQLLIFPIGIFLYMLSILFFMFSYGLGFTVMLGVMLFIMTISFASTAKRFRDRGKSPLWTLINFIPFGSIWVLVECGFFPGKPGVDDFNTSYDSPVSDGGDNFTQEVPQTQTTRFGSNNVVEDNNPKPLFGV